MTKYKNKGFYCMQSKDVVIIKKIINYINEVGTYVDGMSSDEHDKRTKKVKRYSQMKNNMV